jgi:hypothetical protein
MGMRGGERKRSIAGGRYRPQTVSVAWAGAQDVRFGSEADMCSAQAQARFTPNSDRESGFPQTAHVRFTPQSGHVLQLGMSAMGQKPLGRLGAFREQRSCARQNHSDFGELARPCIDLD